MQIISYKFIILKHIFFYIQINSQFRKILMLKVWLSSFFFWGGGTICRLCGCWCGLQCAEVSWFTVYTHCACVTLSSMSTACGDDAKLASLASSFRFSGSRLWRQCDVCVVCVFWRDSWGEHVHVCSSPCNEHAI